MVIKERALVLKLITNCWEVLKVVEKLVPSATSVPIWYINEYDYKNNSRIIKEPIGLMKYT